MGMFVSGPASPVEIDGSEPEYNPLPGFSIEGGGHDPGSPEYEVDIVQATVRLLHKDGRPFVKSDYEAGRGITIEYLALPDIAVHKVHKGRKDYLTIRGTRAQINMALEGLAIVLQTDHDQFYELQVIAESGAVVACNWYCDSPPQGNAAVGFGSVVILALSTPEPESTCASSDHF